MSTYTDSLFHRMKTASPLFLLDRLCMKDLQFWKNYGYQDPDARLNLVMALFLRLWEHEAENGSQSGCPLEQIGTFIASYETDHLHLPVRPQDDYTEFARSIVIMLSGNGLGCSVNAFDTKTDAYRAVSVLYLKFLEGGYLLDSDGDFVVLSTFEMEESLKISVMSFIAEQKLAKANYGGVADTSQSILQGLLMRERSIDNQLSLMRRSPVTFDYEGYRQIYADLGEELKESRIRLLHIQDRIRSDDATSADGFPQSGDPESLKNLHLLGKIRTTISRCIGEISVLLEKINGFSRSYQEELLASFSVIAERRIDLENLVETQIFPHPETLYNLADVLRPLFVRPPEPIFQLSLAFEPQEAEKERVEETGVLLEEEDDGSQREKDLKLARKRKSHLEKVLTVILREIAAYGGSARLSVMREDLDRGCFSAFDLCPDPVSFKHLFSIAICNGLERTKDPEHILDQSAELHEGMLLDRVCSNLGIPEELNVLSASPVYDEDGLTRQSVIFVPPQPDEEGTPPSPVICVEDAEFTLEHRDKKEEAPT